jgi:beta-xylosidase
MKKRLLLFAFCLLTLTASAQITLPTTERIQNPMLWADVPDPDVIRVDDTFYLVSTTMHLCQAVR